MRLPLLASLLFLSACLPPPPLGLDDDDVVADDDDVGTWDGLRDAVDASELEDVTVLIGTAEGTVFAHDKGDASPDKVLALASASKWLSALITLTLAEEGVLDLADSPADHLAWWTDDPNDGRSDVTLEQLLSFTSGFSGGPSEVPCVGEATTTLDACARTIHDTLFTYEPGSTFHYGPAHLQIAAAMATSTTGDRWNRLFRDRIGAPLGLALSTGFALPSLENPRAAGGGTGSAADYAAVLTALAAGELLDPATVERMSADHTGDGVVLAFVPDAAAVARTWHYALGCWRECDGDEYTEACDEPGVLSSPGAFGFYPWWDQARGTWGVLATQLVGGDDDRTPPEITVPLGQAWAELAAQALGIE